MKALGRRLVTIAPAALAVTAVTRFAVPESYVFFGILPMTAITGIVGLALLRALWWRGAPAIFAIDAFIEIEWRNASVLNWLASGASSWWPATFARCSLGWRWRFRGRSGEDAPSGGLAAGSVEAEAQEQVGKRGSLHRGAAVWCVTSCAAYAICRVLGMAPARRSIERSGRPDREHG